MIILWGKYTNADVMIDTVEQECIDQIQKICDNIAFNKPIKIMPDCHAGKGSVVGFTMPVGDKIVPNTIGVDINCGMLSFDIGDVDIDVIELDKKIREKVRFGMNINDVRKVELGNSYKEICERIGMNFDYAERSVGTVGGGNHFIEVGKSVNTGHVWITIHTGSRNLGKKVCEYWMEKASTKNFPDTKTELERIKKNYPKNEWNNRIKAFKEKIKNTFSKSDLDYLENGEDIKGYLVDMAYCQIYAQMNRENIMNEILSVLGNPVVLDKIETVHNYVDLKDMIIRKGSIRSYISERMIIPLNPSDGILLCEGKSNPEWNYSAPHGAGRVLSRSKACKVITEEMAEKAMAGVYSSVKPLDESPLVYKDSKLIEACIEPTATIIDRIKPIMNMKSDDDKKPWEKE